MTSACLHLVGRARVPSGPACSPVGILLLWLSRGVFGTRLLLGRRFAGDKCVCWWGVGLLVKHCPAGETRFAGQTRLAGQTHFTGPNQKYCVGLHSCVAP